MLDKKTNIATPHICSSNNITTPDHKVPVLVLANTLMPINGIILAGNIKINPAMDSANVRTMLCLRGRCNRHPQRGQCAFSPGTGVAGFSNKSHSGQAVKFVWLMLMGKYSAFSRYYPR
jgi:hypothetical protein